MDLLGLDLGGGSSQPAQPVAAAPGGGNDLLDLMMGPTPTPAAPTPAAAPVGGDLLGDAFASLGMSSQPQQTAPQAAPTSVSSTSLLPQRLLLAASGLGRFVRIGPSTSLFRLV